MEIIDTMETNNTTSREESEIAIFWSTMSDFLPKSLEREALGDEKIFRAFKAMYPNMKNTLRGLLLDELLSEVGEDINTYTKNIEHPVALNIALTVESEVNKERSRVRAIINDKKQVCKK